MMRSLGEKYQNEGGADFLVSRLLLKRKALNNIDLSTGATNYTELYQSIRPSRVSFDASLSKQLKIIEHLK